MGSTHPPAPIHHRRLEWFPAVLILAGLALLIGYALREMFAVAGERLPGVEAVIHLSLESTTRSTLAEGRLPYWNPYLFAGMPHLATSQVVVLYPPAMLLRVLPSELFLPAMYALHLWIAGAGALLLARVIGLGWLPSAAVATALTFGGSVAPVVYHGHVGVVSCIVWCPLALALSIMSVRRGTWLPHPALAPVLVVQAMTGLQWSLYTAVAVGLYFGFSVLWPDARSPRPGRWYPLAQLAVLGLITAGLAAFHVLPFVRLLPDAGRTYGMAYDVAVEGGWSFQDLATIFFPFANADPIAPYADMPDRVYVGWLLAIMVPAAFLHRSHRRMVVFCALLTVGTLAFALGDNLPFYRLHHALMPGLRIPGRLLFVTTLALAVLGGVGLERFGELAAGRRWRWLAGLSAIAGAAIVAAAFGSAGSALGALSLGPEGPWFPFVVIVTLVATAGLAASGWLRIASVIAVIVVALDVATFAAGSVHTMPTESAATLQRWLGAPTEGRALTLCGNRVDQALLAMHRQPTVHGLGGVFLRDYTDWVTVLEAADRPSDALIGSSLRRDLLDMANVSTIIACAPVTSESLTLSSTVDSVLVYRNETAWPRAIWICDVEELPRWQVARRLRRGRFDGIGHLRDGTIVDIRWAPTVPVNERIRLEARYTLRDGVQREGSTWRYVMLDDSPEIISDLLSNPGVEDTNGIDRHTGNISQGSDQVFSGRDVIPEVLVGSRPCNVEGNVTVGSHDRTDGHVTVDVNASAPGFVFLSEPYYEERQAFVDGAPTAMRKANLAFIAVPVPAGRHVIELRYVPTSFYLGAGISSVMLAVWTGLLVYPRRKRMTTQT